MVVLGFLLFRVDGVIREFASRGIHLNWFDVGKTMYGNLLHFTETGYLMPLIKSNGGVINFGLAIGSIGLLLLVESIVKDRLIEDVVLKQKTVIRWSIYIFMIAIMLWFGVFGNKEFFYFQF